MAHVFTGHTAADGSSLNDRLNRYGKWMNAIGENIDYGNRIATDIVVSLIIDDGGRIELHKQESFNSHFLLFSLSQSN